MFKYKIIYEKVVFVSGDGNCNLEPTLTASAMKKLNRKHKDKLQRPFVKLLQSAVSLDDNQEQRQKKAFLSVVVMAELVSEPVGWVTEPPIELLADVVTELDARTNAVIEEDSDWEVLSVDEI